MADIDSPLVLETRTTLGKRLGSVRHDGKVPAVIHNFGAESLHVMVPEREMIPTERPLAALSRGRWM